MKVRMLYRTAAHELGKGVSQIKYNPLTRRKNESEDEQLERVYQELMVKRPDLAGLDYDDFDDSQLPVNDKNRDKWTGSKGQGIKIDNTIILPYEIQDKLDAELAKPAPDPAKVAKHELDLKTRIEEIEEGKRLRNERMKSVPSRQKPKNKPK